MSRSDYRLIANRIFPDKESKKDTLKLSVNFFYLLLTNGINVILPIVIIPFLLSRLGIDKFGLVMMAQALMSFLMIVTDYSFNLTGTQAASVNRDNPAELSNIFNKVFTTKLALLCISFLVLFLCVFLYPRFWEERTLFLLSFAMVIGKTLLPIWFFQGIEKMKYIALANVVAKILLIIFIMMFITNASKYPYVNLFYSFGDMTAGIISIFLLKKISKIKLKLAGLDSVRQQLRSGRQIFIMAIANNTYVNANVLILGALTNNTVVGLYAVSEKAMLLFKQTGSLFLQASYPHACKLAVDSVERFKNFMRKEFYFLFVTYSVIAIVMFSFARDICLFFSKKELHDTILYIKWFSLIPLIVALNMPAYQVLIINKVDKVLKKIVVTGAIISVALNFILIPNISSAGVVVSIFATELFVTLAFYYAVKMKLPEFKFF